MDIRLYWEKVYWALAKRVFKRKQKTYEDWLAKGYTNQPLVSFIIPQIRNRPHKMTQRSKR